jgi:peroxiredoxin (alkyl hydroperoxide reductase subunit C)
MEDIKRLCIPQIGAHAPDFEADTTMGKIKLSDYKGKWVILFSHPNDFTPVCTTEMMAFAESYPLFKDKNVELLGLSVDGIHSHLGWINNIYKNTDVIIPFPIIADPNMEVSKLYGMVSKSTSSSETVRTVFIIDDKGIVRLVLYYPMQVGRNIMEILRVIDALQFVDKNKTPTPANWLPGMPTVLPPPNTYSQLKKREECTTCNCVDWYLCFVDSSK